jgi:hypothetical protein
MDTNTSLYIKIIMFLPGSEGVEGKGKGGGKGRKMAQTM